MNLQEIVKINEDDGLTQTYKNVGASDINAGDIGIVATSDVVNRCVSTTTTADSSLRKGIAKEKIVVAKEGRIVILGRVSANVKTGATAVAVGDKLGTSTTAGKLGLATANPLCVALEAVAANTTATIKVEILAG